MSNEQFEGCLCYKTYNDNNDLISPWLIILITLPSLLNKMDFFVYLKLST
jgi:hypothetical protein